MKVSDVSGNNSRVSNQSPTSHQPTKSVFYGLFLSARYIAGPTFQWGERLDSIIIGYVLWTLVTFILQNLAGELQQEAQTGTLEQLFLSRYGAIKIFLMRMLADLTLNLLQKSSIHREERKMQNAVFLLSSEFSPHKKSIFARSLLQTVEILGILLIIMLLTGSRLNFPPTLLLPFVTVVLGANGFAFAMGSLALLFKRIQQLIALSQFPFLFLLTTPTETWTGSAKMLAELLPMTPGAGLLRDLMARGESLNFTKLGIAFINGSVYFAVGLLLFHLAEREAKRRGMLSGY